MKKAKEQRRIEAAEACIARFVGKPYKIGSRDCVKLAGHAMHKMGHRVGLTKGARYSTDAGALRTLKKLGFTTLAEAVDSLGLPRIAPASADIGDLIGLASTSALGCGLSVYLGNGWVVAFQDGIEVGVRIKLDQTQTYYAADERGPCAWRL